MKTIITTAIALIIAGSFNLPLIANQMGKKYSKKISSAEIYFLTEGARETSVSLEEWMSDVGYFSHSVINSVTETAIEVEEWMYDPFYFIKSYQCIETEKMIDLEMWMSDPGYFHLHVDWISVK